MIDELQKLVPKRKLRHAEALAVAEMQAQRLRTLLRVKGPVITNTDLGSIPGVIIERTPNLGVSGATRQIGAQWIILINADEAHVRRRFTIGHEIKHILDDPATRHLRNTQPKHTAPGWLTERRCDYFAACLLIPRMWVKRAWTNGTQDVADLADIFDVSISAMTIRLSQLGLIDDIGRCYVDDPNVVPLPAPTMAT